MVVVFEQHKNKPQCGCSLGSISAESLSSVTFRVQTQNGTQKSADTLKIWAFFSLNLNENTFLTIIKQKNI